MILYEIDDIQNKHVRKGHHCNIKFKNKIVFCDIEDDIFITSLKIFPTSISEQCLNYGVGSFWMTL